MINVYYLSLKPETPNNDYWDYGFLNDFIDGTLWMPPNFPGFTKHEVSELPKDDVAIVIIPARHHADYLTEIKKQLHRINKVVLFLMGDEEADFPVEKIVHNNIHIWVQNPHPGRHDKYHKLGTTYPPQSQQLLPQCDPKKFLDIFFAGQITHQRREELSHVLVGMEDDKVVVNRTAGFTQGEPHTEYYQHLASAKMAPCPSGAVIPDSFRLFEALEAMAIPVADERAANGDIMEYWDWLFNEITPFPHITDWENLPAIRTEWLADWPRNMHQITAWWLAWKRKFAHKVCNQLES